MFRVRMSLCTMAWWFSVDKIRRDWREEAENLAAIQLAAGQHLLEVLCVQQPLGDIEVALLPSLEVGLVVGLNHTFLPR